MLELFRVMKKIRLLIAVAVVIIAAPELPAVSKKLQAPRQKIEYTLPATETWEQKEERMKWWTDSRFGMFIHFGAYSSAARHEWVKHKERMTDGQYQKYIDHFDPDLYDPKEWARQAKAAGMKYAVLTSKHHDGFCLFDSKYTDYKSTNTACGRDIVREFVEAFRAEGLKVGLYYSLLDWHHPDFAIDRAHPQRIDGGTKAEYDSLNAGRNMEVYRQYMRDQVRELLTEYGKIDIMWFDFSYSGEDGKGHKDWDSESLVCLTRSLQPDIIIDSRLDLKEVWGGWDFLTPEQVKEREWPRWHGRRVPWETCQTFSGSWGYYRDEATWKSVPQLLELLIETVSKGGNLILNIGPTGRGDFDWRAKERLEGISNWMRWNSRSIYNCTAAPEEFKKPDNTLLTYNPETGRLYIHLVSYPMGLVNLDFIDKVEYAQFLHDGSEVLKKGNALSVPMVKPNVEIPVIEVFLKK